LLDLSRLNDAAGDLASSLAQAIVLPFASLRRLHLRHSQRRSRASSDDPVTLRRPQGTLVALGGGHIVDDIVVRLIHLAGGRQSRICIVPTASLEPQAAYGRYASYFKRFGAENVYAPGISERTDALDTEVAGLIEDADLVFLGGGNQSRLTEIIGGTPAETALHQLYYRGGVVAGTSAGASVMGKYMPAGGDGAGALLLGETKGEVAETDTPRPMAIARGFGLAPALFIDQHFVRRGRLGRLLYAIPRLLAENENLIGLGLDEATATIIHPDGKLEIIGDSIAIVVDGNNLTYSSLDSLVDDEAGGLPLSVFDFSVHLLRSEQWYDLETRRPLLSVSATRADSV